MDLKKTYLNPAHHGSLGGVERYRRATLKTVSEAKHELANVDPYTILRDRRTKFPRNPVLVPDRQWQFQADLMDVQKISKQNKHFKFILVVIDCFSRKLSCIPVKSKHKTNVRDGLVLAFKQLGFPDKLQTDKGIVFCLGVFYNVIPLYMTTSRSDCHTDTFSIN